MTESAALRDALAARRRAQHRATPQRSDRGILAGDPGRDRAGRRRRGVRAARAHRGTPGQRQGAGRARDPRLERARGRSVRGDLVRRHARGAARTRAVRLRRVDLSRPAAGARRRLSRVPLAAPCSSITRICSAATCGRRSRRRSPTGASSARATRVRSPLTHARDRGVAQPALERGAARAPAPRDRGSAARRARRRHPPARLALPRARRRGGGRRGGRLHRRSARGAGRGAVARQRARARRADRPGAAPRRAAARSRPKRC